MKNLLVVIFTLVIVFTAGAQTKNIPVFVTVIDSVNNAGIKSVYISNLSKSVFVSTKTGGQADISVFGENDSLCFQHTNFKTITLSFKQIKERNFVVVMVPRSRKIEGITIFANKWEQQPEEFPYVVRDINERQVVALQSGTSADVLGNMTGVFLQKSQNGGGSPMIRGFSANGVLIVVNGVRMNNAIFRSGNLQNVINIQPAMIDEMEVVYGPGSITYGSDAMGGVMDFHLKKGMLSKDGRPYIVANYTGMVHTSPETVNHNLDLNFGFKKFAARTVLTFSQFDNMQAGKKHYGDYPEFGKRKWVQEVTKDGKDTVFSNPNDNILYPSAYNSYGFLQNFVYNLNDKIKLSYDFVYSNTSDIQRYDKLTVVKNNMPKYAKWYYGPQKWVMNNLKIDFISPNAAFDEMEIVLANQVFEESRHDRKFNNDWLRHRTENVSVWTLNADFNKKYDDKLSFYYGTELDFNNVKSAAIKKNIKTEEEKTTSTRYPNGINHYFSAGLYANGKYKYAPNITLLAGLRFSYVMLNSSYVYSTIPLPDPFVNLRNFAPNASLGVAWLPMENLQVNFNISSAFRAPNIDDVSKMFDSEPGKVTVPNDNLKPEYAYSAETSASYRFGDFLTIGAEAFYTFVDNIMVRRDFSFNGRDSILYDGEMCRVQAIVNAAHGNIYGGNFNLKIDIIDGLNFLSDFTMMKGYDNNGNALRHVPPAFGSSHLNYRYKKMTFELFSYYSGGIAFNDLAPEEQGKSYMYSPAGAEPWFTVNFRYSVRFKFGIELIVGASNILDRFYIPYASGIAAPGRNFSLTFRTLF